ncbi:MAG: MaoC family dehydratase [Myxococcales bacterium]|nr:MAG: MaoC family dehydratase [Myxococcales bacterium]
MGLNMEKQGKTYGPYRYKAGLEKIKEFAEAIKSEDKHYLDEEFAAKTPHGGVIAPPTFCVNFNMRPFAAAVMDPELNVNVAFLVHGEQEFEFFRPVKDGDILITTGVVEKMWTKGNLEFFSVRAETKDESGQPIVTGRYTGVIRNM